MMKRIAVICLVGTMVVWLLPSHSQENRQVSAPVPVGTILAWHVPGGSTAKPPAGWQLWDGSRITASRFTGRFGQGHHIPNLNGNANPTSKLNAGQHSYLRGSAESPSSGYGGQNTQRHRHGLARHSHAIGHSHGMSHSHGVSLQTSTAGGIGGRAQRGTMQSTAGRHTHDVRG